ncbi:MAG: imidazole glycerol phosphate synthase subunit HisF [Micrococcales bacterium]|nr:imidazole glycerol phosphate synthase subunit HisF [Micrococcales bacterium]MBT5398844.1 imidazole glycerol phosphate synthase subunit HisF [Micrococcales bacterium]MBT5848115.1 imidazole glycerol phosphate synthase subunit HisF [Micrococcales bacterium]MBT7925821.1 imidazole glycerol phosphate synthase subunit HisF [Micrococcales bacterium]
MPALRVIPCLDVAAGRVVKGVNFADLKDSGDPVELAKDYYLQGADELTFLDVTAATENRSTTLDMVTRCAEQVFIPLTVGGGIRSLADVTALLTAGADKISVGSAGVSNPELLREISSAHGNQILVISLDLKRGDSPSGFVVTTHGGRKTTDLDGLAWVQQVQELGAGELLVNSIDADGTQDGFDLELIELIKRQSSVPVIASGGAGSLEHFVEAAQAGADAVLAASVFHNRVFRIDQVKQALREAGFEVR